MTGAELILAERERQVSVEGWTPAHDALLRNGEMAIAAIRYAAHHTRREVLKGTLARIWPWPGWWKPKDPVRDLVRAGALIAAEIDRLQQESH